MPEETISASILCETEDCGEGVEPDEDAIEAAVGPPPLAPFFVSSKLKGLVLIPPGKATATLSLLAVGSSMAASLLQYWLLLRCCFVFLCVLAKKRLSLINCESDGQFSSNLFLFVFSSSSSLGFIFYKNIAKKQQNQKLFGWFII